ncbi:hypothetical protein F5882DRAFT_458690 [Hyaloscypha sp. PMI_1271]|nr:hypothetical protein F5882DRAFT_458690 [Hyaloscypha sp. PMI_1271]
MSRPLLETLLLLFTPPADADNFVFPKTPRTLQLQIMTHLSTQPSHLLSPQAASRSAICDGSGFTWNGQPTQDMVLGNVFLQMYDADSSTIFKSRYFNLTNINNGEWPAAVHHRHPILPTKYQLATYYPSILSNTSSATILSRYDLNNLYSICSPKTESALSSKPAPSSAASSPVSQHHVKTPSSLLPSTPSAPTTFTSPTIGRTSSQDTKTPTFSLKLGFSLGAGILCLALLASGAFFYLHRRKTRPPQPWTGRGSCAKRAI